MKKKWLLCLLALVLLLQVGAALASNPAETETSVPEAFTLVAATPVPTPEPTPRGHAPRFAKTPGATIQPPQATPKAPIAPAAPTPTPALPPAATLGNALSANRARYDAFAARNPQMTSTDVVVAVNLKLDEANYSNIVTIENPESTTVFISKHYGLPRSYKPQNLVSVDRAYAQSGVRLRSDCYKAYLSMAQDMEKEGLTLYIKSGYRTNRKRGGPNDLWYVWPGHSEHQTGLAFDLRKKNVTYSSLGEYKYHKTEEYAWLCEHAYRYGFILSYPYDKTDITGIGYEPWHWRYVGVNVATDMKEKGFDTFHEYWATYLIQDVMK